MNAEARPARVRRGPRAAAAAFVAVTAVGAVAVAAVIATPGGAVTPADPQRSPGVVEPSRADVARTRAASGSSERPAPASTPSQVLAALPAEPPSSAEPLEPAGSSPPVAPLEPAEPLSIVIPALDVDAGFVELGLHDDGTVEVPPHAPLAASQVGWYRHSPTPGALGPSIVIGHVDSDRHGPSVFHGLGTLTEGDIVEVHRADGVRAVFAVTRTAQYGKDEFPTAEVYGDLDHAGLRLITCGGDFDTDRLEYDDNIVVYAELVSSHRTR